MLSPEQILENAARDGSIDITQWPRVLESVLQKLHHIVHHEFPQPSLPLPAPTLPSVDPEVVTSTPPRPAGNRTRKEQDVLDADADADADADENEPPRSSQSSTKENDAPAEIAARRPPVPGFGVQRPSHAQQPPRAVDTPAGTLPPDLLSSYTSSTQLLRYDFAESPPYTVQRLAELVLRPKTHYRFLPSYLRALDRIVSVSSPESDFPLPALHPPANGTFLTNGDAPANGIGERGGLGSDESLGGALLTPIPWLRHNSFTSTTQSPTQGDGELHSESTETIEGPHGAGSVETVTVTVNGVPSASSAAHTTPPGPSSPTLSEQSDASSSSSSGGAATTEAQLREQGGVTQGELLRQEQEAGVVPLSQTPARRTLMAAAAAAVGREPASTALPGAAGTAARDPMDDDEQPHARGPEEITVEDMGPQHGSTARTGGLDIEAAVGRGPSKSPQPPDDPAPAAEADARRATRDDAGKPGRDPADVEKEADRLREGREGEKRTEAKDADGDIVVADAEGRDVESVRRDGGRRGT